MRIVPLTGFGVIVLLWLGHASPALAQTDEIQVYDAAVAPTGAFNLALHNNLTPSGNTTAHFPGGIVSDHSLNGDAEWAYGVAPWFEGGFYLPLYSITRNGSVGRVGIQRAARILSTDSGASLGGARALLRNLDLYLGLKAILVQFGWRL